MFEQIVPLMAKAAGAGAGPVAVPLNPIETAPPLAAMVPFQEALVTATFGPVDIPSLAAATLIVIAPVVAVYIFFQRHFIRGVLDGALKG